VVDLNITCRDNTTNHQQAKHVVHRSMHLCVSRIPSLSLSLVPPSLPPSHPSTYASFPTLPQAHRVIYHHLFVDFLSLLPTWIVSLCNRGRAGWRVRRGEGEKREGGREGGREEGSVNNKYTPSGHIPIPLHLRKKTHEHRSGDPIEKGRKGGRTLQLELIPANSHLVLSPLYLFPCMALSFPPFTPSLLISPSLLPIPLFPLPQALLFSSVPEIVARRCAEPGLECVAQHDTDVQGCR